MSSSLFYIVAEKKINFWRHELSDPGKVTVNELEKPDFIVDFNIDNYTEALISSIKSCLPMASSVLMKSSRHEVIEPILEHIRNAPDSLRWSEYVSGGGGDSRP